MAIFGYGRVSTDLQTSLNQRMDIEKDLVMPVDHWYEDHATSGTIKAEDRPQFAEMLSKIQSGDTVVFSRVDRVGRRASNVLNTVEDLISKGVVVYILQLGKEPLNSPMGKVMLGMMSIFAEMDRDNIVARVNSGLARTRSQGTILGKPSKTTPSQLKAILAKLQNKETKSAIAREFNMSLKTILNYEKIYLNNPEKVVEYEQMYKKHMEQIKINKLKDR